MNGPFDVETVKIAADAALERIDAFRRNEIAKVEKKSAGHDPSDATAIRRLASNAMSEERSAALTALRTARNAADDRVFLSDACVNAIFTDAPGQSGTSNETEDSP